MGPAILAQVGPIQLLAMFHFFLWLVAFGEHVSNSSSWHGHAESDRHQAALRPGRSRVEELHRAGRRPDGLLGSLPAEPTIEQLSALNKRLTVQDIAAFTGFAIFVPFGQRVARASKFRTYVLSAGGYTVKELPIPASFIQWRAAFRVLRTALIMLDAVGLANLHGYEMVVERLSRLYPACWHLVHNADELARSAHSNHLRSRMRMDIRAGKTPPPTWDDRRPWDWVYGMLSADTEFWHTQVHAPALAWMASGSKGTPNTPAEMVAVDYLQGGLDAITPAVEPLKSAPSRTSRSMNRTKTRRDARKKKAAEDKAELTKYRAKTGRNDKKGSTALQKCYGWNNGNGPCSEQQPGQQCLSKTQRLHRCTICDSPGHPARSCPNGKKKG